MGNDCAITPSVTVRLLFQFTFPRGERRICRTSLLTIRAISIHVPTWGTTSKVLLDGEQMEYFNSRSHVGNDIFAWNLVDLSVNFNSRSHVGNDMRSCRQCAPPCNFNSRSHVGNDRRMLCRNLLTHYFNSRSHVGNDGVIGPMTGDYAHTFQFTFPRGERQQIFTNILCFFMQ